MSSRHASPTPRRPLLEARRIDPDRTRGVPAAGAAPSCCATICPARRICSPRRVDLAPGSAEPLIVWGDTLRGRGDLAGATDRYSQAAELEPDNITAYLRWVNALIDGGDTEQAERLIIALARENSQSAEVMEGAGRVFRRLGADEDAAAAFGAALDLAPGTHRARASTWPGPLSGWAG